MVQRAIVYKMGLYGPTARNTLTARRSTGHGQPLTPRISLGGWSGFIAGWGRDEVPARRTDTVDLLGTRGSRGTEGLEGGSEVLKNC